MRATKQKGTESLAPSLCRGDTNGQNTAASWQPK
jgi:hypothetical protein